MRIRSCLPHSLCIFAQGALYCAKKEGNAPSQGRVALVLGAGNQASVICHDILHMLMAEDAVVICKMNPVNEYLGPYIRSAPGLQCIVGCRIALYTNVAFMQKSCRLKAIHDDAVMHCRQEHGDMQHSCWSR